MNSDNSEFFYEVSPTKLIGRDIDVLTYAFREKLASGQLVEIPVGSRLIAGVVIRAVPRPNFVCKNISRVLFREILPPALLKLNRWIQEFYAANPATVWQTMLPAGLLKKRRENSNLTDSRTEQKNDSISRKAPEIALTDAQKSALKTLREMNSGTAILRGVTGSGKTEIYKSLARDAMARGESAIILVPEISLTTQLVRDFQKSFANVLLTHSSQKETERFAIWQNALTSSQPIVAIGPRSALFLPLKNLGLIVIDECHEPTYIQENAPRYNALRVAAKLAEFSSVNSRKIATENREKTDQKNTRESGCKLILGSATPSISDVFFAKKLGRPVVEMTTLAQPNAIKATTKIIDLKNRGNFSSESKIFSRQLFAAMRETLADKKQILLFHNRRGTAGTTLCENCGWIAMCPRCYLPLTLHADKFELRCHLCNFREKPPLKCPECGGADIAHRGIGTKKIAEEIAKLFPAATVRRFDGDTEKGQTVAEIYDELRDGQTQIIVGTQQIAKGLDLPNLNLVGVVQADAGLNLPDFGARERTFQLIAQAAGRVGRRRETSRVIIQTFQPDAPAVVFGAKQDYWGFYDREIRERQRGHFPPFSYLLKLTCQYKTEAGAIRAAGKIAAEIRENYDEKIAKILGPAPAFYERMRENYRWQIVVRASSRNVLNDIAKKIPAKNWTAELDPNSLI